MKKLIVAMTVIAGTMGAAHAQSPVSGPYIGVAAAVSDHSFKAGGGITGDVEGFKPSLKVFGGVALNQTFGLEAGYTDLSESDVNIRLPNGSRSSATFDGSRAYLAGTATHPLNDQFSVYGKLGVGYTKAESRNSVGFTGRDTDTGLYAGIGGQYKLTNNVALTLEYERYGKSKDIGAKADAITLGAKYSF